MTDNTTENYQFDIDEEISIEKIEEEVISCPFCQSEKVSEMDSSRSLAVFGMVALYIFFMGFVISQTIISYIMWVLSLMMLFIVQIRQTFSQRRHTTLAQTEITKYKCKNCGFVFEHEIGNDERPQWWDDTDEK